MEIAAIIKLCERLYHDRELSYVVEWKQKHGSKAVGFLPVYVPRELIHAAGLLPVGLMGAGEGLEVIQGDSYFQSYICHLPRSTTELGLSGKLDSLDGFLFPATCDVIRNLSGMWQLLFKEKYVKYVELPQSRGELAKNFYLEEIETLKKDLEKLSGTEVTSEALSKSIALFNGNRKLIRELYQLRSEYPHRVPSWELYLLVRAANLLEVSEHTRLVQDYLNAAQKREGSARDNARVVLTGVFCEQPPLQLIKALETSGCTIVDDDWVIGPRFQKEAIENKGAPLEALVCSYFQDTIAVACRYCGEETKGEQLVEQVRNRKADGVIFCAPNFCDPALLERPMLQNVLLNEKIPFMAVKYAENTHQLSSITEQAGTFADSVRLWNET